MNYQDNFAVAALPENASLTGQVLVERGLITPQELQEALAYQARHGGRIGEILFLQTGNSRIGLCEALAEILGTDFIRPDQADVAPDALSCVSPRWANHYGIIPVYLTDKGLGIATPVPQDTEAMDELEMLVQRNIIPLLSMPIHIQQGIKKHYGVGADTIQQMRTTEADGILLDELDLHTLDEDNGDASIIRFVNQIIVDAYKLSATDIHFEPEQEAFRIRCRVDGMLEDIPVPAQLKQYQSAITSRLKVMAKLDIAEQRLPQDGKIPVKMGNESFDLRVSVLPTPLGEGINLRLLRRANIHLTLGELGYATDNLAVLENAARRPNGIILVTGPTGSGKTTSLYALLEKINTPDRKIITVEDPIEYHLQGIMQMQVHEDIGFTFARALRSMLRHDPDIALVGEIRDPETAEIAIRMAMTGHLVLSTLHTNDAASTIARLIDMGEEPYLLASTIVCVVAQRLIRLICPHCKTRHVPDEAMLELFRENGAPIPDHFFHGVGCERCRNSGYLGRSGIHEVFAMNEDFRNLIMSRAPAPHFRDLSRRQGIRMMREDGWGRVLAGDTTVEEILRVTQAVEG